jgi:hypothetical protein
MNVASRLPTVFLISLVLVATTLLIAGYGIPVGIGVVAGALLGGTWIAALLALHPRTSGGATYRFGGLTTGPLQRPPGQELLERHHHDWMRVAGVDASALRRVIAVGAEVEAGGAQVELVAIEVREDGGVSTVATHTRPPVGPTGHFADVVVSDDAGSDYVAAGQGSGGGGTGTSRYDVRFSPAPPPEARVLTIRIAAFDSPFPIPEQRVVGPWEFTVQL